MTTDLVHEVGGGGPVPRRPVQRRLLPHEVGHVRYVHPHPGPRLQVISVVVVLVVVLVVVVTRVRW